MAHASRSFGLTSGRSAPAERAQSTVLVRAARQLITLHGPSGARRGTALSSLAVIPDGALLISNGRIEDVGPTRRIERLKTAQDAVEVDATGSIVMPAFLDTACHLIPAGVEMKRAAVEAATSPTLAGMARHGTLTVEAQINTGDDPPGEQRLLRILASLQGRPLTIIPTLLLGGAPAEALRPLLATIARLKLARSATAVLGARDGPMQAASHLLQLARSLGMHTAIQASGEHPDAAFRLTMESEAAAVHGLEWLPGTAVAALANTSTVVTLSPTLSDSHSRDRFAPARQLIDQGAALALATYFSQDRNPVYNMPYTQALACRHMAMTCEEAISASTINAAYAAGCAADSGSLEPGKWADLVLYDCANYQDTVLNGAVNQISRVLRHGKTVYRRGRVEDSA